MGAPVYCLCRSCACLNSFCMKRANIRLGCDLKHSFLSALESGVCVHRCKLKKDGCNGEVCHTVVLLQRAV